MTPHQQLKLPLQIGRGNSIPFSMLGVGNGVTDDVLKENLQDATGLFVDQARDTLDTATTSKTTDSLNTSERRAICE